MTTNENDSKYAQALKTLCRIVKREVYELRVFGAPSELRSKLISDRLEEAMEAARKVFND